MSDRTYWKSLAQLADDPRARSFLEREFPEGASELPEHVSRRTMLTLLGASVSMAGLAGCRKPVEEIVPYVRAPEDIMPGIPQHYATTMPLGHGAYGLVVESHEGRPTKIEGNELHPATVGSTDMWAQAAILNLYDPDRSRSVVQGGAAKTWKDFVTAWQALEAGLVPAGGAGLAVLVEPFASPTLARLAELFRKRFPEARWVVWEPVSDENVYAGVERAAGRVLRPVHHLDRAEVILALDSDFLLGESERVRNARGYAEGRRVRSASDSMNRLWVVEGPLTLTGSNADHRLRLASGDVAAFLAQLAAELAERGLGLELPAGFRRSGIEGVDPAWTGALADDLLRARGSSAILAGRRQGPVVHAAVLALNAALGNVGRTVVHHEPRDVALSRRSDLVALAAEMRDGRVSTLVMLGGNPVYDAPVDLDFAGALAKVETSVHLSDRVDETSERSVWHLPRVHFLEAWGDARTATGEPSVVQPLIAPLFDSQSDVEVLGLLATGEQRPGYDRVRETWAPWLPAGDADLRWKRVLHDGLLADGRLPEIDPGASALPAELFRQASSPRGAGELEVVFQASPTMLDGRFANNGWLQELPDPVTKLTWDNAALVAPATARELGLENEDVVRLRYRERTLELPVWILPGQAEHSVALHLGWGRRRAGRVGNGRGFDAYALRTSLAPDFDRGLAVEKTGRKYTLATTQDQFTVDDLGERERIKRAPTLVREAALEEFRAHPGFAKERVEHPPLTQPFPPHSYDEGYQWGMSIDLNVCTGCNACVVACQSENNIPIVGKEQVLMGRQMHWIRVDRYFSGPAQEVRGPDWVPENPQVVFQPVPCMHCENAPCEQVCPVAATVHDAEGLNTMVYNRCIGTRYCSNNCPYKVRRFNFFNYTKYKPEIEKLGQNPDVTVRSRGVMEKCTYCVQRINRVKSDAKLAGREVRDGEVRPACEQACPTRAIVFGNIRDPRSRVSVLKAEDRDYALLGELNNRPRTSYLAKLRNPHPGLAPAGEAPTGHG